MGMRKLDKKLIIIFRLLVSSSVISFVITSVLCYSLWGYYWSEPPYPNLEYGNVSSQAIGQWKTPSPTGIIYR
ncbi:MAG: hypothetical protein ACUVQY_04515 [Thermoproteota archaeon]